MSATYPKPHPSYQRINFISQSTELHSEYPKALNATAEELADKERLVNNLKSWFYDKVKRNRQRISL